MDTKSLQPSLEMWPHPHPQMHGDMLLTTLKGSKQVHGEDTQIRRVKLKGVLVNGTQKSKN